MSIFSEAIPAGHSTRVGFAQRVAVGGIADARGMDSHREDIESTEEGNGEEKAQNDGAIGIGRHARTRLA